MSQQIVDKGRSAPAQLYPLIVGAAVALGIALRLRGAQGDLWLDEIWTLRLIAPLQSAADIFLRAPSDNNHYLNSLWLWLVGPEASTVTMRLASIIIGGLSIIAAAAACRRHSATAAAVAAILVATSYFFVHYGSEARGYAGMILCILTAKAALDRLLDDEASLGAWMLFALAICVGVFFHLTMVEAAGALALAALAQRFTESRPRRGFAIALVAGAACIPGLACFAAGMFSPRFHMGSLEPFTFDLFFQGLGGAIRATFGVPAISRRSRHRRSDGGLRSRRRRALAAAAPMVPRRRGFRPAALACGPPNSEPVLSALSPDDGCRTYTFGERSARRASDRRRRGANIRCRRPRPVHRRTKLWAREFLSRRARRLCRVCATDDRERSGALLGRFRESRNEGHSGLPRADDLVCHCGISPSPAYARKLPSG